MWPLRRRSIAGRLPLGRAADQPLTLPPARKTLRGGLLATLDPSGASGGSSAGQKLRSPRSIQCPGIGTLGLYYLLPRRAASPGPGPLRILAHGEVSEWLMVPLSKSGVVDSHRGFESRPLRQNPLVR